MKKTSSILKEDWTKSIIPIIKMILQFIIIMTLIILSYENHILEKLFDIIPIIMERKAG